jgi:hypothetical protein
MRERQDFIKANGVPASEFAVATREEKEKQGTVME